MLWVCQLSCLKALPAQAASAATEKKNTKPPKIQMQAFFLQTKKLLPCSGIAMMNADQSAFRVAYEVAKM